MTDYQFTSTTQEELVKEFQNAAASLQQEFMAKIQQAQTTGDFAAIQQTSTALQEASAALTARYQSRLEEILSGGVEEESLYAGAPCTIDLEKVVYDGDRDYLCKFKKDPEISRCQEEMRENNPEINSRRSLLKSSLRLTPLLAPHLYAIVEKCKAALGLKTDVELYTYQDTRFNASCYPPGDGRLYIMLTSSLLENFSEGELAFVIGHEIGHALFDHFRYSASGMMEMGSDYLSPLHAMKLFAWERSAEISADRIGLLCCGDYDTAAKTFFKLSSGITGSAVEFQLNEYIKQFLDLEEALGADTDPEDWFTTHPFGPLRIKALHLFNESETYAQLTGKEGGSLTEEEMEGKIMSILSLMEPKYLDSDSENGALIQRFIFLSGYLISLSDGTVAQEEIQALGSLTDAQVFTRCLQEVAGKDSDSLKEQVSELAVEANRLLSPIQKLNMIRDLAVICFADDELDEEEVKILYGLCRVLNINPEFADRVIHDLEGED